MLINGLVLGAVNLKDYNYSMKIRLFLALTTLLLFIVVLFTRSLLINGRVINSIPSGSSLSGIVETALIKSGSSSLPKENINFVLKKTVYEDSYRWAIVTVSESGNDSVLILKKINGVYLVVLGPDTVFPISSTFAMPSSVSSYLNNNGLVLD
jgi:hypothetical protein